MKKYLSLLIVLLLVSGVGIRIANAIETTIDTHGEVELNDDSKGKMDDLRNKMKEQRMGLKTEFEAKRQEMKDKWVEMRMDAKAKMEALKSKIKEEKDAAKAKLKELRVTGRENALARFDVAIDRMDKLSDQVSLHITALGAKGVDVAAAQSFVVTAEAKLDAAKTKTIEANDLLSKSADQLTAEEKTKLQTLAKETHSLLQEARMALKDAVKALKDAIKVKMEASAKVEAETETNNQ